MRIVTLTLAALATLWIPAAALAGEGCASQSPESLVSHIFDEADGDSDGALTASEYEAAGLQDFGVTFGGADLDGDGKIVKAEYIELYERVHDDVEEAEI